MHDKGFEGRLTFAALAACAACLLASCGPGQDKASAKLPTVRASLVDRVRVLAGDALVIDGVHVRLSGVYAPQGPPDARCWAEAVASKQATIILRRMIVDGRSIEYKPTGGQDVFTRTYAKVTLNGVDLAQTLYDEGLVAKKSEPFGWCRPISEKEPGAPELTTVMDAGY